MTARLSQLALAPPLSEDHPASGENDVVRAAAGGNRAAFEFLYTRYARMVHGILLARVPVADAEDLVQDVFFAAFRKLRALRSPDAFAGWLAAIARNRATEYHRSVRNEVAGYREYRSETAAGPPTEAMHVLDTIRHLPEAYRETLILRLVEGMTGPEIAERTGLTPDSVRVNLFRGMKLLREQLGGGER